MKPQGKVKINWSPGFAYAIGLIVTDGNLSKDGRHINFTSKDLELAEIFRSCLELTNKIGKKARGGSKDKKYFVVQFGDVIFFRFLLSIGLTTAKSKVLKELAVPNIFFIDFFRGCIDGDGSITSYKHPESQNLQLRLKLCSASLPFLVWVQRMVQETFFIEGGWISKTPGVYELVYGKEDAQNIFRHIYYNGVQYFLNRKFLKAKQFMGE